ncbi:MAG: hypothetical protein V3U37_05505, partial [Nitrospinaceae bacterium]
ISLLSDDDIIFTSSGDLTTSSGNISVTADNDSSGGGTGGAVTMADGTVIDAGSGTIAVSADEDITLGRLVTTSSSDTAVTLTSTSGGVVDGGDTGGPDVDALVGRLVADVVTGFGTSSDAIETRVFSVDIDNTTSGDVNIFESDSLDVFKIDQGGPGDITVSYSGSLTGQEKAIIPEGSTGKITFTQRQVSDDLDKILGDTGKSVRDLSTETTVNLSKEIESTFSTNLTDGVSFGDKTVTKQIDQTRFGPFVVDVFSEDFGLVELDQEAKEIYEGLGGLESFWGFQKLGESEMVKQNQRSRIKEEASIDLDREKKRSKRARTRSKAKAKKNRVKKVGETASIGD